MSENEAIRSIADLLDCSPRTAESLYDSLRGIIGEEFSKFEKIQDGPCRYLRAETGSGNTYFAAIARGYFISSVYRGSADGERIYRAIR